MSDANVRVVLTGHGQGEVFIDGVKVPSVKSVVISSGNRNPGSTNTVVLTLTPSRIEFEGVAAVLSAKKPIDAEQSDDGCDSLSTIALEMRGYAAKGLAPDKEVLRHWAMILQDAK